MKVDAVIPARGGSRRLPGKNLAELAGLPLIAHSIQYACCHPLVDRVWVTTEDDSIAAVATDHGARVIDRPSALADDVATTSSVIAHAVSTITDDHGSDAVVTLQPTSPLRLPLWLDQCIGLLEEGDFDSVITVSPTTSKVGTVSDGRFRPEYEFETRSQDLPQRYAENGAIYVTRTPVAAAGSVFGTRVGAVITDHVYASVDIDTRPDLDRAAFLLGVAS